MKSSGKYMISINDDQWGFLESLQHRYSWMRNIQDAIRYCIDVAKREGEREREGED